MSETQNPYKEFLNQAVKDIKEENFEPTPENIITISHIYLKAYTTGKTLANKTNTESMKKPQNEITQDLEGRLRQELLRKIKPTDIQKIFEKNSLFKTAY